MEWYLILCSSKLILKRISNFLTDFNNTYIDTPIISLFLKKMVRKTKTKPTQFGAQYLFVQKRYIVGDMECFRTL